MLWIKIGVSRDRECRRGGGSRQRRDENSKYGGYYRNSQSQRRIYNNTQNNSEAKKTSAGSRSRGEKGGEKRTRQAGHERCDKEARLGGPDLARMVNPRCGRMMDGPKLPLASASGMGRVAGVLEDGPAAGRV